MSLPRVDLHHHFLPDFYRQHLIEKGQDKPDGFPHLPDWSEEQALALMDKINIQHACLSISSPGVYFGDIDDAKTLSRQVNACGADLQNRYPERFSYLASVPLPDVDAAVEELCFSMDNQGAKGLVMHSNSEGIYAGDEMLIPLYEALNARKGILFIHPTSAHCGCCNTAQPSQLRGRYPAPVMEFIFETTRTISDYVHAGFATRFPDIRMVVPHAGAALPLLANRIDLAMPIVSGNPSLPKMSEVLKEFYFDLAGAPVPDMLDLVVRYARPENLVYGSDWPFTPEGAAVHLAAILDNAQLPHRFSHQAIMADNGYRLLAMSNPNE